MPLRIRILLWVCALFLAMIFTVFTISNIEIHHSLRTEEANLVREVKNVDEKNFENILKFLSTSLNDEAEKVYNSFLFMNNSPQWLVNFLPDEYNVRTKSWGSSAAALATYPWLDFINVQINGELDSYIHQADPYMRKYFKLQPEEDLCLFATKLEDGLYHTYVGVPIMQNKAIYKYIDQKEFPNIFRSNEPDHWVLYDAASLFELDTKTWKIQNERIYKHVVEEAITISSKEEFEFLFTTLKLMVDVTKAQLAKRPELLKIITNKEANQKYVQAEIDRAKPDIEFNRSYCDEPLCKFAHDIKTRKWVAKRSFANGLIENRLLWQLAMLTRTGAWDYDPFAKGAPGGIVTGLIPTLDDNRSYFDYMTAGIFTTDVFINDTIKVNRECGYKINPNYQQSLLLTKETGAIVKSCQNKDIQVFYDENLSEPYITLTKFVSYLKPPMVEPNVASITLGVQLDTILLDLALVSPDEVALVFNDGRIRLYTTDGEIYDLANTTDNENRNKIATELEGTITEKDGKKLYFTRLTSLTKDNAHIVLIEKEVSRTTLINTINDHVNALSRKVILHSLILIGAALVIISIILNRVLSAVTKPINNLANITGQITSRKLESIEFDPKHSKRKDEIGTLYSSFQNMITSMKEGNKVRGILDKVVSKQVAEKIIEEGVKLGGEKRVLSVMFADIRNFTSITEKMDPVDVLEMLNECLTLLSAVIDDFEGVIDKYEGDLVMALFGAPLAQKDHSQRAIFCAIEMQKTMDFWNEQREENGLCRLDVGIGIHTGEAVAGNVGAENHLSYTVLGSIVNLSSRLCDSAGGGEILITKETLEGTGEHIEVEEQQPRTFKGFSEPITTYTVIKRK